MPVRIEEALRGCVAGRRAARAGGGRHCLLRMARRGPTHASGRNARRVGCARPGGRAAARPTCRTAPDVSNLGTKPRG
ncbi:hypothetical protein A33K_17518 [Burkholderia humptydooensis MSMB43]|uniref:Uncharacterized protein n=1 Tax=Burkholderia humptydooensis MSMB43 TaxID=441157 RepID=A0ABN0G2N2_9BURK|nr:hypothetical protein A33K_17518 [Burkholderia humptydooensis MSMB43]